MLEICLIDIAKRIDIHISYEMAERGDELRILIGRSGDQRKMESWCFKYEHT